MTREPWSWQRGRFLPEWRRVLGAVGLLAALALGCGEEVTPLLLGASSAEGRSPSEARELPLRFAVVGHLYPIARPRLLEELVSAINGEQVDLVFVLGDSALEDSRVVQLLREGLEGEVFFTPGNHELHGERRERYLQNVGYMEHHFYRESCHFVLLNSSAGAEENIAFLEKALADDPVDELTVLLTHHRIWDDTLLSSKPYQHDKSYYFSELYPVLRGKVDAIFAGNSKRQYFRDLEVKASYGPQNLNNVYWADQVGSIAAYSVGMGDGVPKAGFVVVEVVDGKLLLEPRSIAWDGRELVDRRFLQPHPRSRPPAP